MMVADDPVGNWHNKFEETACLRARLGIARRRDGAYRAATVRGRWRQRFLQVPRNGREPCPDGPHAATVLRRSSMNYYHEHRAEFLEGLKAFLRIPSISALSEHKTDIRRAAEFARAELERAGLRCRADRRPGQSAGIWRMAGRARASRPFSSTGTTTYSRPIRSTSGSRRHSSPKFAATTSSRAARPTTKARSTSRSKPSRAC